MALDGLGRFTPKTLICPTCGIEFVQHASQQTYCCTDHAKSNMQARHKYERDVEKALDQMADTIALLNKTDMHSHGVETCGSCSSKQNSGSMAKDCWRCGKPLGVSTGHRDVRIKD